MALLIIILLILRKLYYRSQIQNINQLVWVQINEYCYYIWFCHSSYCLHRLFILLLFLFSPDILFHVKLKSKMSAFMRNKLTLFSIFFYQGFCIHKSLTNTAICLSQNTFDWMLLHYVKNQSKMYTCIMYVHIKEDDQILIIFLDILN